jgi:large subunit ribosomal protein L16
VSRTKKSAGMRMGKGKGNKREWICPIKKGTVVYEVECLDKALVIKGLTKCGIKMPFTYNIVNTIY